MPLHSKDELPAPILPDEATKIQMVDVTPLIFHPTTQVRVVQDAILEVWEPGAEPHQVKQVTLYSHLIQASQEPSVEALLLHRQGEIGRALKAFRIQNTPRHLRVDPEVDKADTSKCYWCDFPWTEKDFGDGKGLQPCCLNGHGRPKPEA